MTEFDEIKTVQRIRELHLERLQEFTPAQIGSRAKNLARHHGITVDAAYAAIKDDLLSSPPQQR